MKKSVKCPKCGLVSFTVDGVCKRCRATIEPALSVSTPSVSGNSSAGPRKSYTGLLIGCSFLSFVLGSIGFAAVADHGVPLGISLFFGIFVGGVLVTFILISFLKNRNAPRAQATSGQKSGKVLAYPLIMFIVLLPAVLVKLGVNASPEQLGQAIGSLVATCFFPAVVTGIWINRSKRQWSWAGAGLRYLIFFLVFCAVALAGRQPR